MRAPLSFLALVRSAWLAVWALVALATPWAAADVPAVHHLDGASRHLELTVDRRDPTLVHARFPASGVTVTLRTEQPLQRVIVVDLDGDRRFEIVTRDRSSGLRVWTLDGRDRERTFRPYRPWRTVPRKAPPPSSPSSFDEEVAVDDGVLKSEARPSAPADAAATSTIRLALERVQMPPPAPCRWSAVLAAPSAPRPPPVRTA